MSLTGITIQGVSGTGSNGNEGVLFIPQSSRTAVWLGLVLWHINHCRLFNAKSSSYKYIKYMICKHFMLITFLNEPKIILLYTVKWFQVLLCITNNSIKFVYTQLNTVK